MAYQGGNFTGRNKAPFPLNVRAVPSCTCMVRALGLSLLVQTLLLDRDRIITGD
jgi:hypothetical protein